MDNTYLIIKVNCDKILWKEKYRLYKMEENNEKSDSCGELENE